MEQRDQGPQVAVIGGGAAGFFLALTVAELRPEAQVMVFEQGREFLSKVRISGEGAAMSPTIVLSRGGWRSFIRVVDASCGVPFIAGSRRIPSIGFSSAGCSSRSRTTGECFR